MARYLLHRVFWAVWLFFVATLIVYVIFWLVPSDPAHLAGIGSASPIIAARIRSELHLDVPVYQQYWIFIWNMIRHQSLGNSTQNGAPVRWIIGQDAGVTGSLVLGSAVLWILISVPIGIVSALRPGSFFDRVGMVFVLIGVAAPPVWLGLILAYVFGFKLGWTPIADYCNFATNSTGECSGPVRWADHLILPWLTFACFFAALYVRMIRASIMEVAQEDFVRTAMAKGAPARRIVFRHILRNSLLPVVTLLGANIAYALSTVVFVEQVFNLHGLGVEMLGAAHNSDVPVVVGVVVFVTLTVIVTNLLVDVAYAWLDPRIRLA